MYEGWTPEREALLKELWTQGLSASQIAARLGGNITRNAVIGKKNRLCLPGHNTPRRTFLAKTTSKQLAKMRAVATANRRNREPKPVRKPIGAKSIAPQMRPAPMPLPERQADDIARVSFNDLESRHCRYIPGEPRGHPLDAPMYCGLPRVDGASYCAGHMRRCQKDAPPLFTPSRPSFHDASAGHSVFGKSRERV